MNSAAGRGIIGLGTGENTSVIPEIPVKAHSKTEQFDEEQIPLAAPELNDPIPPYVGEQPSLKVETEEGNKKTTEEDPEASARSDAAPERKIPEAGDNSGEGSENRRIDSGGTAGSSGFADDPDSGGSASSPVERVETPSSGNSAPQIIIGDSSGGNVPDQGQDYQIPENSDRQTLDYPSVYPDEPESTPGTDVQLPEEPSGNTDPPLVFDSTHPVKELADISQLADVMGYQPAVVSPVPEGWGISSIEVIWGITAQITYSDGLDSVLYRTSAGASILNSDSGTYTSRIELGGYILEGDSEDSVSLITWTSGDSSYSMFFDRPVSQPEGLNWAGSVM
jgi:hypothetical protein